MQVGQDESLKSHIENLNFFQNCGRVFVLLELTGNKTMKLFFLFVLSSIPIEV